VDHLLSALSEKAERQSRRQITARTNHCAGAAGAVADDSEAAQGTRTADDFGVGAADGSEPEYAQSAVAELTQAEQISKHGLGRATWYSLKGESI
jgi:hypothetical protein